MDELISDAERWCNLAGELLGHGARAGGDHVDRLLGHIEAGMRFRRRLDGRPSEAGLEASRRSVLRRLVELRHLAESILLHVEAGTPGAQKFSLHVKRSLGETRAALRTIQVDPTLETLGCALAVEGLRGDLEWLSVVVSRLDHEPPQRHTSFLEVELERARNWIVTPAVHSSAADAELERLRGRCDRLLGVLLERRVRREIAAPTSGSPERLLLLRLHLSRLQAYVDSLEIDDGGDRRTWLGGDSDEWAESLSIRRIELAEEADASFETMGLIESCPQCERAAQEAGDEISEAIAFIEDMPLRRAVKRLELAQQDLDQLTLTLGKVAAAPCPAPEERPTGETPDEEIQEQDRARERIGHQISELTRLKRKVRGEWQEKLLALRLQDLLGPRAVALLELAALWLILLLAALIVAESLLEHAGRLTVVHRAWFAWADLGICSVLLAEFALKLSLAPRRGLYFLRHFVIDFLASLPFGFLSYCIDLALPDGGLDGAFDALRLLRFGRLIQMLRYVRLALPAVRLARVGLFVLRLSDRLVRQHAGLLNRNIVLFEPYHEYRPESADHHRLSTLRAEQEHAGSQLRARLDQGQCRRLAARVLSDLDIQIESMPAESFDGETERSEGREIPVEALVDRLIQLSPEQLVDRMGEEFVTSTDRYLRLLDAPMIRRLPMIRNLVAYREKSPAEAVTLAANYLGNLIQRFLDIVYFLADLQGTLSPPVFLDRLGATIINAARTPAKRLLWLGTAFLLLFLVVNALPFLEPFRGFVDGLWNLLGWPVIILGAICLGLWRLGAWFRKIANQSADFCERVVEAQFAAQTKQHKARRRDQDAQFLAERVIDPELLLRSSDDHMPELYHRGDGVPPGGPAGQALFENRELIFLRNVRLLYQDYLDGSPFHRSDTKASVQLLGNLALTNLRRSHLGHLLREGRALDRLDLNRAGSIFGGPYLWFNYITRMIVQETAILLMDYNRHAIPLDRLACSPAASREAFRDWLARRLRIEAEDVVLPEPMNSQPPADQTRSKTPTEPRRREADAFLETVEFTAIDFLADDPQRGEMIRARFGPQVAELVRRDRQQNVRRAFRSFPLHELPLARRTINPFLFYETYLSRGRIIFLPFVMLGAVVRMLGGSVRGVYRVVREILHPRVDLVREIPPDTYLAAQRKIHRMRKPHFMGSLWLRARFDVEYLGLPLPTAPSAIAAEPLIENDLDFIGASWQDRIIAEQIHRGHQRRLHWIGKWLKQFGWTFDTMPQYLAREIPYLTNRGGEALRALVTACVLDHDDIATLAFSIEGLKRVMARGADPSLSVKALPTGLPDPIVNLRKLWHPVTRLRRPRSDLFDLPCFPSYDQAQRARILSYLHRHRRAVRGWIYVVLGQGGDDPWGVVRDRMREVLLRTDLWSDQVLVLRAVQTLTMLDVQLNCDLVRTLGGYTREGPEPGPAGDHGGARGSSAAHDPRSGVPLGA